MPVVSCPCAWTSMHSLSLNSKKTVIHLRNVLGGIFKVEQWAFPTSWPTFKGPLLVACWPLPGLCKSTAWTHPEYVSMKIYIAVMIQLTLFNALYGRQTQFETRTSSPLRINRGRDYQSVNVRGLFPSGEGAGYAGGIMSAGVDGIEVAEALAADLLGLSDAPVLQGKGSKAGARV